MRELQRRIREIVESSDHKKIRDRAESICHALSRMMKQYADAGHISSYSVALMKTRGIVDTIRVNVMVCDDREAYMISLKNNRITLEECGIMDE